MTTTTFFFIMPPVRCESDKFRQQPNAVAPAERYPRPPRPVPAADLEHREPARQVLPGDRRRLGVAQGQDLEPELDCRRLQVPVDLGDPLWVVVPDDDLQHDAAP